MARDPYKSGMPAAVLKYRVPQRVTAGMSVVGFSGLRQFSGQVQEEFLPELKGQLGIKVYKEMRDNDPIIGAILFAVGMLIRQASWSVIPASEDAGDKEIADFVDSCRTDMSMTWADVLSEIMTMLPFGWSYLEEIYKKRNGYQRDGGITSKYSDGRLGWRKLPLRSQDSLDHWDLDDQGGCQGMFQRTRMGQTAYLPIEKSLLFRTESNKNNPEGRSVLRNSYRPWYFKKRIEEIEGIGIERDLAGLPVLTTPEGVDLWNPEDARATAYRTEGEKVVRSIRRDEQEGILLPFGWELSLLSTGGRRTFDTSAIIDRYNNSIAMTIMADFIVLGHNNRYGSFALSGSKTHMFGMAIGGWLDAITGVFNSFAVPRLMAVNGIPPERYPRLEHGDIEIPDLEVLGAFIERVSKSGFKLFPNIPLEKALLRIASLPVDGMQLGREVEPPDTDSPTETEDTDEEDE